MKRLLPLLLLPAASAAVAGMYDQPYALVTTDRGPFADPDIRPVIVSKVDGRSTDLGNHPTVVEPGRRAITLDLPPRGGFTLPTQRTLQLEAEACKRYYVSAKLATPTTQDWQPVVRGVETIGECARKFAKQ